VSSGPGFPQGRYEFDVTPGLLPIARAEFEDRFPNGRIRENDDAESLLVEWDTDPAQLTAIRTAASLASVLDFPVARPKALLGDENLRNIVSRTQAITSAQEFHALRLSAAGSQTPTMQRIATEIANAVGLAVDKDDGDLLFRVRRYGAGWQVLIRHTPRPLSVRSWRVVDYPVAVNACVAAAMVRLARIAPQDKVLNVMCGSATIAIEAALAHSSLHVIAVDNDNKAVAAAEKNAEAAGVRKRLKLERHDATKLALDDASIDVAFADPPWSGDTKPNLSNLYGATLAELSRVVRPRGRLIWLSHQIELSQSFFQATNRFVVEQRITISQGGLHPSLWTLRLA
jgi:tRNA (guanine6-N2)-methyltransferase